MVLDGSGSRAIGPACGQEQDQKSANQRLEEGASALIPFHALGPFAIEPERRAWSSCHQHPECNHAQDREARIAQAFFLFGRQRFVLVGVAVSICTF